MKAAFDFQRDLLRFRFYLSPSNYPVFTFHVTMYCTINKKERKRSSCITKTNIPLPPLEWHAFRQNNYKPFLSFPWRLHVIDSSSPGSVCNKLLSLAPRFQVFEHETAWTWPDTYEICRFTGCRTANLTGCSVLGYTAFHSVTGHYHCKETSFLNRVVNLLS